MSKAIEQLKSGFTVGHAGLGFYGNSIGSVRQIVHDGDTINVRTIGNVGTRFLGVDAAEISFTLPGKNSFTSISDNKWETFLSNPFDNSFGSFSTPITPGLQSYIQSQVGPGTAQNHYAHAVAAQKALEEEIQNDIEIMGNTIETFQFYLNFAYEVIDRYGRMLCFINRNQPLDNVPAPRPLSYNERLLAKGMVTPYFIWPNISPFIKSPSLKVAVIDPYNANQIEDSKLRYAREAYQNTRFHQIGVYEKNNSLRIYPFKVRFLAQRRPPSRWVINLGKSENILIPPQEYYTVPNPEDRLFIPEEFIPLFKDNGWKE